MLRMKQIEAIKEMQNDGSGPCEIAEKLSIDRKTVSKYMKQEDFTPLLSVQKEYPSKLDKWKETIDGWLEEDRKMRFKQRHTAKRIHQRLQDEFGDIYDCSYPLVQRYCKGKKEERKNSTRGYLELVWHAGEAQVDFGEADSYEEGVKRTIKYLCVSFPYSNGGYIQIFGGETAECVTQGLQDIFRRVGGVPRRLVFDNAAGVGKRIGEKIKLAELFLRFKCHYGFDVSICNPYSGHEKGNVENKVGYVRRNLLVPAPRYDDITIFNRELLERCEKDWDRKHYKKQVTIAELFEEDRAALSPLVVKPFNCVRYEKVKTDGYGKFCLDGRHWYSSAPEMGCSDIVIAIGAHYVDVLNRTGESIVCHRRMYGNSRTDSIDWTTSASRLFKNPGAWKNSGMREIMPVDLRKSMDEMDMSGLKQALKIIRDLSGQYDYETVILAMTEAVNRDTLDGFSASVIAARIINTGLDVIPESGPDLTSYDCELINHGRTQ
ncbi:MAG: IS21 family transposase [Euryarchaeota archaeon]|nr:IS21 family transposase [Euryarchaeota archaeon]